MALDDHVAIDETSCWVPSLNLAVAVNWRVKPATTAALEGPTATAVTLLVGGGLLPPEPLLLLPALAPPPPQAANRQATPMTVKARTARNPLFNLYAERLVTECRIQFTHLIVRMHVYTADRHYSARGVAATTYLRVLQTQVGIRPGGRCREPDSTFVQ
jgi:hypothetical protein